MRQLLKQEPRVETEVVQFGEDWPGTFIRGDNGFAYADMLDWVEEFIMQTGDLQAGDLYMLGQLRDLRDLLKSSRVHRGKS